MKIDSFWVRTALVCIGSPILYAMIVYVPQYHHLALNACVVAVTVVAALEVENLFRRKGIPTIPILFSLLSATLPLVAYLEVMGVVSTAWGHGWLAFLVSLVLLRGVWIGKKNEFKPLIHITVSSVFTLVYPGLFLSYVVRLSSLPHPSQILLFTFSVVFGNDIMAYLAGKFLARRRLGLLISPKKTAEGFIVGFLSSVGITVAFRALYPSVFRFGYPESLLLGALLGILTILGDLVESGLKRSAQVKDSSNVIPGRGGFLDCLDSILFTAPMLFLILKTFLD